MRARDHFCESAEIVSTEMNIRPLVSAIIPTYNRAHVICEAVESALAQTYSPMEVIVVDDGSTDNTLERLREYKDRISAIRQANAGPATARNRGVAASHGELIAFLDSDDLWLPSKIERQVALLRRAGDEVPCCLCNIMMRWNAGDRASFDISSLKPGVDEGVWLNVDEVLATRPVLFNQGIMIRRTVLNKIGGFDERIRYLEDIEFPLRLSLEGPWAFIKEPLVVWRESMTNSVYKNSQREELCTSECMVEVLEGHLARLNPNGSRARVRRHVSRELTWARRHLWAVQMRQMDSWGPAISNAFARVEHYRRALFRRSPWFPKMKVAALPS